MAAADVIASDRGFGRAAANFGKAVRASFARAIHDMGRRSAIDSKARRLLGGYDNASTEKCLLCLSALHHGR